ncbi:MAG: PAS domain-containing sensor histidine kinase [Chloroflexi bacterium]|nr:MAG: PAS domain-containing sensor histidine kinase [Chloroflexota bacterium]
MIQKAADAPVARSRLDWRPSEAMRFAVAAGAGALALVLIVVLVGFEIVGQATAEAVDDLSPALVALAAAVTCALAARRSVGRRRLAWSLIAASAFTWGLGAAITGVYEVSLERRPPVPSIADVAYLIAYPLAVAAVMAVPTAPRSTTTRGRAFIDAGIIASALVFMALAFGLGSVYRSSHQSTLTDLVTLARPFGDIVVLTVLIPAVLRSTRRRRGRLLLLLGGFTTIAFSDGAYAILTASSSYHAKVDLYDIGWVSGFILIALAPIWPLPAGGDAEEEPPASLLEVAVPLLSLVLVATTTLVVTGTGAKMDVWIAFPGASLGILLTVSQLLTHRDSLALLTKSRRTEVQLQERTAFLNQVIGHTPAGLARVSREFRITDPNPRLCTLFRAPSRVIVGSSLADYLPEADVSKVFDAIPAVSNEIDTVEADSQAVRADGSKLWVNWSATPVRNARGGIEYFLAMFDDVTSDHDADAAAMANLASLERLSKLKSEFVTMVSHEFRTALTGIQGYSEVMRDDSVTPEEVKEFAGDINSDAERLSRMITEMLDLDRMEAGRMKLNLGPIDINVLLSEAAGRARVASSKHRITVQLGSGIPTMIGDSDRIVQVVANLLSNAIKYSPAGGEVELSSSLDGGNVKVCVRDHGPGIPPEFIDHIFGRYERYEGNAKNQVIGTGLGLAIGRQIVEMHKGRIWVESTLGVGSSFCFTIPIAAGVPAAPSPPATQG